MANTGNTQQIIDYGATANDGQGDPLRTAFIKTEENFDNIWLAGPVGSNITIVNNTIGVQNTNGNLTLAPNGVGVIQARNSILPWINTVYDLGSPNNYWRNIYSSSMSLSSLYASSDISVGGDLSITGNLIVTGNIIEVGNITTDTKVIYLSNTALVQSQANGSGLAVGANGNIATFLWHGNHQGWTSNSDMTVIGAMNVLNHPLYITSTTDAGNIWTFSGEFMTAPTGAVWSSNKEFNTEYISGAPGGSISLSTLQPSNVYEESTSLHIGQDYFEFTLYDGLTNAWKFNAQGNTYFPNYDFPAQDGSANHTLLTNGAGNLYWGAVSNYANANAAAYAESGWAGNIIPSGNGVYSLGSTTNYWSNLWVANNTIYIGGVPLGMTVGNVLTVDGNVVVTVTTGNVANVGNFEFNDNALENPYGGSFDNGSSVTGWTARLSLPAGGGLNPALFQNTYGNIQVGAGNNAVITGSWTFDNEGNLELPSQGNIVGTTPNNAGHLQWVGNSSGDGFGYTTLRLVPDDTAQAGDQYIIIDPTAGGHIHIRAGGAQDNSLGYLFLGGENSYFQVPAGSNPNVSIASNSNVWNFQNDGNLSTPGAISAAGNITAPGLLIDTVTGITANAGNVDINQITGLGGWLNAYSANISGNINGANLNVSDANISGNVISDLYIDGNVQTMGNVEVYGNIYGEALLIDTVAGITANAGNVDINQVTGLGGWLNAVGANLSSTLNAGSVSAGNLNLTGANVLINNASGGDEGSEIQWAPPAPANTTISGNVVQDVYQNGMRFFESGGSTRGLYIDIGNSPAGASTAVGYREVPQITFSANATAASNAAGCHYYSTTAGNLALTLPDDSNVAFPVGATLTIVVNAAGNVLVNQDTGVSLYQAGSSTTGNRVVGAYGLATVMKLAANTWVISGTGVY